MDVQTPLQKTHVSLISVFELAFLQCKILLLWHGTKSMNLDTMPCGTCTCICVYVYVYTSPYIFLRRVCMHLHVLLSTMHVQVCTLDRCCEHQRTHLLHARYRMCNALYIYMYICIYVCVDVYVCMYIYLYACMPLHVYAYMHGCIYMCTCMCMCMCMYIYVYVCVYIYICISISRVCAVCFI